MLILFALSTLFLSAFSARYLSTTGYGRSPLTSKRRHRCCFFQPVPARVGQWGLELRPTTSATEATSSGQHPWALAMNQGSMGWKSLRIIDFFHTVSRGYANCNTDTNHCSANLWGLERPDQQACAAMIAMTVSQILRLISKIWIYLQSTGIRCTVGSLLLFNHIDSMMWSCHQFKRDMLHFCCVYGTFLDRRRDSSDGQTIFCIAWKDRRGKLSVPTDKPW